MPTPKLTDRQETIFLVALLATLGVVLAINWASKRITDLKEMNKVSQKAPELRESLWTEIAKRYGDRPRLVVRPDLPPLPVLLFEEADGVDHCP